MFFKVKLYKASTQSALFLTSVTAKLLFPQGTILYHLSCNTSINPWDLYWLMSSDILEVSGELGGRPMPYPRREYNLRSAFHLRASEEVPARLCDIAISSGTKGRVSFYHLSFKGHREVQGMIITHLLPFWVEEMNLERRGMGCAPCSRNTLYSKAFCFPSR